MPSDLDRQLDAIMDAATAPGALLETSVFERGGQIFPAFRNAPPTLPALFDHFCAQHGDAEFIVDGDTRLTFAQTHRLARRVAAGLAARHGVKPGDRVGIAARNSANWIVAYMGVLMAGGCATLLNGWWSGEELAGGLVLAGCALLLTDPQRAERLVETGTDVPVVGFEHGDPETGLSALLADEPAAPVARSGDDIARILFTSGSTGVSKAAWSDHRASVHAVLSFVAQTAMIAHHLVAIGKPPAPQQAILVTVPLFHVTGEIPVFLQSMVIGRKLVMMPRWDAREAMRLIERERVTYFIGVPLMSAEIAAHPERASFDLSSCRFFAAGGAPRPPEHVDRIRAALPHAWPLLGYGLTETNAVGCGNLNENYLAKPGSTGPASRPLVQVAILGPEGDPLPAGATGEVAIRSICNFGGYWNNPEATAQVLRADGYVLTGDLGHLDEDGYLFIVDRKKDIIIRGGENIACTEVEQALYAHPAVAEATVFGLPDERLGEVPVAVVTARPGMYCSEDSLREFAAARIARFKVPVRIWLHDGALPRLGTEKVDKRTVRARYAQGWEAGQAEA